MSFRLHTLALILLLFLASCSRVTLPVDTDLSPAATAGGAVVAWGSNYYGQTNVPDLPEGVSYTAVAGGHAHSLGLRSDGQIVGWGDNEIGQINIPALPEGMHYTAVAAGTYHSLAVRSDGQVIAWGNGGTGQTNVPALPEGMSYTAVAGGAYHSLALRSDGQVVAWGYNNYGQTDVPLLPEGVRYIAVASGSLHSLALRSDGEIVAWGENSAGQSTVPALPAGTRYTAVAAGSPNSLALRSDGQVIAWGRDDRGQTNVPALPTGMIYTGVASGALHNMALRNDGRVIGWGDNGEGQTNVPALPEGMGYIFVASGDYHSLAIIAPKQSQTLSFTSQPPTDAMVGGIYTPSAEATSGLSVTFGTSTPSICTVSGSTVSFLAAGACTITADQSGNLTYSPAPQVTQSFAVMGGGASYDPYTIDLTTASQNTILRSVKVGSGVTYSGTGTAISDTIRVDGYRYLNGKRLSGNQVKVVSISGDKVLAVVKVGTNTPNPTGGELDIKPGQGFGGPSLGKNGLVTLKSITVDGVSTNGAKLVLYGNGQPIKTITLAKIPTQTLTLNEPNVGFMQVRANDSFTVDDVVFEVPIQK